MNREAAGSSSRDVAAGSGRPPPTGSAPPAPGLLLSLAVAGSVAAAVPAGATTVSAPPDFMRPDSLQPLIRAQARLGFRLLDVLARDDDGSVVISPPAVGSVLAILHAGASGESRRELASILGAGDLPDDDRFSRAWGETLRSAGFPGDPERVELDEMMIALAREPVPAGTPELYAGGSLWIDEPREASPEVAERLHAAWEAEVATVPLHDPAGRSRIDEWLRRWTLETVTGLPHPLREETEALVLGSLYFRGGWRSPFPERWTAPASFRRADGSTGEYPFIRQTGEWRYRSGRRGSVVRIPYGGNRYALYVALPPEGRAPAEMLDALGPDGWAGWIAGLEERTGEVRMPRVRIRGDVDLTEGLRRVGLHAALDPDRGRYDRLLAGDAPLGVTRVRSHGILEIDEEGTRAVSVVSGAMEAALGPADEPFELVADRPFVVVLRDDDSGAILLAGVIRDPAPDGYPEAEEGR